MSGFNLDKQYCIKFGGNTKTDVAQKGHVHPECARYRT